MKQLLQTVFAFCLITTLSNAQQTPERIRFEYLTVADGLPDNSILDIIQDHLGFIWMGTLNGLVRYDGNQITTYQYSPNNPHSLKLGIITFLYEDVKGDIWIGSTDANLYRFERSTQKFIEYPNKNTTRLATKDPTLVIENIHEDKKGNIWTISTDAQEQKKTIDRLNPETHTWTAFRNKDGDNQGFSDYNTPGDLLGFCFAKNGETWITTTGEKENYLFRLDEKSDKFIRYIAKPKPEISEDSKQIYLIQSDKNGQLYFSSQKKNSFFSLNPQTGEIKQFKHDPKNTNSLRSDNLYAMYVDNTDFVWVGTPKGIDMFDPSTNKFTHYASKSIYPSTPFPYLYRQFEDSKGNIWFGGYDEVTKTTSLSFFDRKKKQLILYHDASNEIDGLKARFGVNRCIFDKEGFIWIATQGSGLNKQSRTVKFPYITKIPNNKNGLLDSVVTVVYEAPSEPGIIWFGTNKGLSRFEKKSSTWKHYVHDEHNKKSLSKARVSGISEDKFGRFWVATGAGLNLMDRKNGTFTFFSHDSVNENSLIHDYIMSLKSAADGKLWIGTNMGVSYFDYDNKKFSHFIKSDTSYTPELFKLLAQYTSPERRISAILHPENNEDKTAAFNLPETIDVLVIGMGELDVKKSDYGWIEDASGKTIWEMNKANTVSDGSGRIRAEIVHLNAGNYRLRYKSDELFSFRHWQRPPPFHTEFWGLQISKINEDEAKTFNVEVVKQFFNSISDNFILSIGEDKDKNIYLGTNNSGVTKYTPTTGKFDMFQSNLSGPRCVTGSIIEDDKTGNLWVGDYLVGLELMTKNGKILKTYNNTNGLSSNSIEAIQPDASGMLWLSTNNGLCRFNPTTGNAQLYNMRHGLQDLEFNPCCVCRTTDGEIYFGGKNGVNAFYPEKIGLDTTPPKVLFSNFSIFGKPASIGKDSQMSVHISVAKELILKHNQNDLTFEFTTISFNRGNECKFAYKLSPNDVNWIQSGTLRQARYSNLSPGNYTFSVKASNADGFWNETGTSITIKILPPWWQTWWAYLIYAFAIAGSLRYYILFRSRKLEVENIALEQKISQRTTELENKSIELEKSLTELNVTQNQLIEKEKIASNAASRLQELDNLKTRLYTNITHEFRTPLTVILGMAQQMSVETKHALSLQMIIRNGENLLTLVNQMLDLSKLESGTLRLNYQHGDVVIFVKYLTESFHSLANTKKLNIHFHSDAESFLMDYDEMRLQQVVSNLLTNAIKFTPERGKIFVALTTQNNKFSLKIQDNGIGISDSELPNIFDRFYQADTSATRHGEGTGIGLALTQELVKLMDGTIVVKSVLGEGTEFIVELPIDRRDNGTALSPENISLTRTQLFGDKAVPLSLQLTADQQPITDKGQMSTILVSDDNADVRTYISSILSNEYNLIFAKDGKECEDLAFEHTPDLIITDVMMPMKDGFEVCKNLKTDERTSHIPIIMLTAKADMESKLQGIEKGADVYLMKPFHKEELLLRIKKLLELRQQLQKYYLSAISFQPSAISSQQFDKQKTESSLPKADSLQNAFVIKLKTIVEKHLTNADLDAEKLSREVALSHAQLNRKLTALTGLSSIAFIRYIRLIKAKELLLNSNYTVNAIAYDCGFNDPSYFVRIFKQEFGAPPQEWREKNS